jgi:glycerol-3-phosphate dehydrogenase
MSVIERRPEMVARAAYDLIIVGGGIHGACLSLEAVRRGLRPLLIEKGDFGSATSANTLRVLHGGLRYLQSVDLPRVRTSIRERRWFCRNFPDLVRPLPCLMPLYGRGLRRPGVMRVALALNDLASIRRNRSVTALLHLPGGRVLDPVATARAFPNVQRDGLVGGALWYDAIMTSSERVLMEVLRWSAQLGAAALNYVEAVRLRTARGQTTGVEAIDHPTGRTLTFEAPVVINCAGPWAPAVAAGFDTPAPELFTRALAFNVIIDREPVSDAAVAVEPTGGGRMLFLVPWHGRILAGTYHATWASERAEPMPDESQIEDLLTQINLAVPGLDVARQDVVQILAGFMPAARAGDGAPSSRTVFVDHARRGGPIGLYSSVGVKFTTARDVAEQVVTKVFGRRRRHPGTGRTRRIEAMSRDPDQMTAEAWLAIVRQESVLHFDDLLLRRTDWDPLSPLPPAVLAVLAAELDWDVTRQEAELKRLAAARYGMETV